MEFNTDISYAPHDLLFVQHHKALAHVEIHEQPTLRWTTGHNATVTYQRTPTRCKLSLSLAFSCIFTDSFLAFSLVFLPNVIWKSFYSLSNTAWTPVSLCLILLKYMRLACIYFWYFPPDGLVEHCCSCAPFLVQLLLQSASTFLKFQEVALGSCTTRTRI